MAKIRHFTSRDSANISVMATVSRVRYGVPLIAVITIFLYARIIFCIVENGDINQLVKRMLKVLLEMRGQVNWLTLTKEVKFLEMSVLLVAGASILSQAKKYRVLPGIFRHLFSGSISGAITLGLKTTLQ